MPQYRQMEELKQLLLKQQATFGTAESSLTNSDFAEVEEPMVGFEPAVREIRYAGANSGFAAGVVGPIERPISFNLPLRTSAIEGGIGLFGEVIRGFGFKETASDTDADSTNDRFIYTPSDDQSDWKDFTAWGYSGNKGSSKSVLRKVHNIMFAGKIVLDFNSATAILQAQGKGAFSAINSDATQATCTSSGVLIPAVKGVTFSFLGDSDYCPLSLEVDFNQEVMVTTDPTQTHGKGITVLKRNGMRFTAKFYKDTVANIDPETALVNRTVGGLSVGWGTAPNKWTISSTKAQVTSVSDSNENGIETYDVSGILIDNDLAIQLDTAVAS